MNVFNILLYFRPPIPMEDLEEIFFWPINPHMPYCSVFIMQLAKMIVFGAWTSFSNFLLCNGEVSFDPANLDRQFLKVPKDPLAFMNLRPMIMLHLIIFSCHMPTSCMLVLVVACSKPRNAPQKCKSKFDWTKNYVYLVSQIAFVISWWNYPVSQVVTHSWR